MLSVGAAIKAINRTSKSLISEDAHITSQGCGGLRLTRHIHTPIAIVYIVPPIPPISPLPPISPISPLPPIQSPTSPSSFTTYNLSPRTHPYLRRRRLAPRNPHRLLPLSTLYIPLTYLLPHTYQDGAIKDLPKNPATVVKPSVLSSSSL
jgi:hypothetical protein